MVFILNTVCPGSIPKFYVCKFFSKRLSKIQLFICRYKYSNVFSQLLSISKKIAKAVYLLASFQNIWSGMVDKCVCKVLDGSLVLIRMSMVRNNPL